MAWQDDKYIRQILDSREKWGVVISVTAAAALMVFLADHPHKAWLDTGPLVIGVLGSIYVLIVDCYHEQAEAIADASNDEKQSIKAKDTLSFAWRIGVLGWMHALAPMLIGLGATVALAFGLD